MWPSFPFFLIIRFILWSKFANNKLLFQVCLGFQIAAIQFAKDHLDLPAATSEEFDSAGNSENHVVVYMPEIDRNKLGGTMRLGLRETKFQPDSEWSKLRALYGGAEDIWERHRHRYEINPKFVDKLEAAGLHFIGKDETGERMEVFELKDHPFYIGTQFHAEYLSRVLQPSKPYLGFVAASAGLLNSVLSLPNGTVYNGSV